MTDTRVDRRAVGLRSERGPVLLAVMLSTALVALDSTIVATAVPAIVRDLGGFDQFPWLFSVYLLAQAATVPVNGKIADTVGRKPVLYYGIGVFLLGSVLCGLAWSMPVLIAARALQGLGAGAVQPMGMTVIGDLYSLRERAAVQGYVASVWGISSVVGPTLGGVFSQLLTWRLIFWVNLPLCLLAAWLLRRFRERTDREPGPLRVDVAGGVLLTGATVLVVLALLEGGRSWAWSGWQTWALLGVAAALLAVLVPVERRAVEPVLPPWVLGRRVLLVTSAISLLVGALIVGLSSYVPTLGQEVLGGTAIVSGFALAAMTMGWPIAASQAGRLYLSAGFRVTGLTGSAFAAAGAVVLVAGGTTSLWWVSLGCLLIGFGMGLVAAPSLVAAQSSVSWRERGVVTAVNMFCRSLGSAIGVAAFGAVVNASVGDHPTPGLLRSGIEHVFVGVLALTVVLAGLELLTPHRVGEADAGVR